MSFPFFWNAYLTASSTYQLICKFRTYRPRLKSFLTTRMERSTQDIDRQHRSPWLWHSGMKIPRNVDDDTNRFLANSRNKQFAFTLDANIVRCNAGWRFNVPAAAADDGSVRYWSGFREYPGRNGALWSWNMPAADSLKFGKLRRVQLRKAFDVISLEFDRECDAEWKLNNFAINFHRTFPSLQTPERTFNNSESTFKLTSKESTQWGQRNKESEKKNSTWPKHY